MEQHRPEPNELSSAILAFLARNPGEQFKAKEIARRLGYGANKDFEVFKLALFALRDADEVMRVPDKMYQHKHVPQSLVGLLRKTRQGFGFVVPEDGSEDVFIADRNMGQATHGDRVELTLYLPKKGKRDAQEKREGEVKAVVERGRQELVGTVETARKAFFVIPDDTRVAQSVVISQEDLNGARPGDKVVITVETWGDVHFHPEGKVREVLGKAGELSTEIVSVAKEFRLPLTFPPDVVQEASGFAEEIPPGEIQRRKDVRSIPCITIDPVDARDFDDALTLEELDAGTVRLGVHIADVSAYVREGKPLDREARTRGTSVYFPTGVIPMLPERLSGDLCSLKPNVDRLAFSVFMDVTSRGIVKNVECAESVIHSCRRFTYEEVQKILDGDQQLRANEDPVVIALVEKLRELSGMLTKKRMREGSVDFESPEAKFEVDESGIPLAIHKKERQASHRLVEECMLLANRVVAREFGTQKKEDLPTPFLFRVHDLPDPAKAGELASFVATFGYKLHIEGGVRSTDLQKLLEQVRGSEVENLINEVAIRSMAKAEYSPKNIGHYGLAFDTYTHFTSPIRRYPDLIVHRMMKEYLAGMPLGRREDLRKRLPDIAKHSSERERNANEAERAATKVMQVEYMKRHLGDEFTGVVSGVMRFGLFVEIDDLLVEGMIHVRSLDDDFYTLDEKSYTLIGQRKGRRFRLGDIIRVQVASVDPEQRRIDFRIVDGAPVAERPTHRKVQEGPSQKKSRERPSQHKRRGRRRN